MSSSLTVVSERTEAEAKNTGILVSLLTGGFDQPYAYGLSMALAEHGVHLQVVGSDEVDSPAMHATDGIEFLNWQSGWLRDVNVGRKAARLLLFYFRLIMFAARTQAHIFHILWNNKLVYFDRTVLMLYFRLLGKRVMLTAHNVNTAKRDGRDSWLNRLTLKVQYLLAHRIFVHTQKMRSDLTSEFGVRPEAVTVIPFGLNNAAVHTSLTLEQAKRKLGIGESERALLFFGRIQPYKGLEHLVDAVELLASRGEPYRLIIAGEPKKEHQQYWRTLKERIENGPACDRILQAIAYIPDRETEIYFKAADALVLPYTDIYQSGVLFLGYSFGLPVIATDVGSFREEIIEGETGLICRPADRHDLAKAIERYFSSSMYRDLSSTRANIRAYASLRNSWDAVADITVRAYQEVERSPRRQEAIR